MWGHKHDFKQDGRRLFCSCGEFKMMPCNHLWQSKGIRAIEVGDKRYPLSSRKQEVENYMCMNCGEFKQVNLTTGEVVVEK